jgi:hypothetical protein
MVMVKVMVIFTGLRTFTFQVRLSPSPRLRELQRAVLVAEDGGRLRAAV